VLVGIVKLVHHSATPGVGIGPGWFLVLLLAGALAGAGCVVGPAAAVRRIDTDPRALRLGVLAMSLGTATNADVSIAAIAYGFTVNSLIPQYSVIPDLWWLATNGWPTIAMTQALNQQNGGLANIGTWVIGQLLMVNIALAWVWILGIRFLWRSDRPLWRALVWAYGLLFVLFALTTGAKSYYLAAGYVYLLAAGAVRLQGWWAAHRARSWLVAVATALTTALVLPVVSRSCRPATSAGSWRSTRRLVRRSAGRRW
jgi:hypothetical protein